MTDPTPTGESVDPARCAHPRAVAAATLTRQHPQWLCRACRTDLTNHVPTPLPWQPADDPTPPPAAAGGARGPEARIRAALDRITLAWPATLDPPRTVESSTRIVYGPRSPGPGDALAARTSTTRDLGVIAWHLRTRLNLATVLDGLDITQTTDLLWTHADSLAILDSTALPVIEAHAKALDEIVAQTRPSRIRVADCPRCASGVLYAALRAEDPEQLGNVIACDNRDQVDVVEDGVHVRRPVCTAAWTSFEWRACWREVRSVYGPSGRRTGKPTRWDESGVRAMLAAIRGRHRPVSESAGRDSARVMAGLLEDEQEG